MEQPIYAFGNQYDMSTISSFTYSIILFAFESVIVLMVVAIIINMTIPIKEDKLTRKKFKVTKYKNINKKDKKMFVEKCVNPDDKQCFLKKMFTKQQNGILEKDKTKYLLYTFCNLLNGSENNEFENLQNFVNIVIDTCDSNSFEILLKISSPGGVSYKFEKAYSHLMRLKENEFKSTALIDDVCASGGYMLACACNKIISSRYAKIGSVGVRADTTNCHVLLNEKMGIDYRTFKTGDYKDMIPFGEKCTDMHIERMNEMMNDTLIDFANIVKTQRNLSDDQMGKILTAKVWTGTIAKEHGLVDDVNTPDSYLQSLSKINEIFVITSENGETDSTVKSFLNMKCIETFNTILNNFTSKKSFSSHNNIFL